MTLIKAHIITFNDARPPLICKLYNYITSILNVCRGHGGAI